MINRDHDIRPAKGIVLGAVIAVALWAVIGGIWALAVC